MAEQDAANKPDPTPADAPASQGEDQAAPATDTPESPSDQTAEGSADASEEQDQSSMEGAASAALAAAEEAAAAARSAQGGSQSGDTSGEGVGGAFQPPPVESESSGAGASGIDLLSDVNLDVKIELGRTRMYVEDVLRLAEGAVVELDKLAGDPVDVYVNDRHVARGEVLILNDSFCIRVNEVLAAPGATN